VRFLKRSPFLLIALLMFAAWLTVAFYPKSVAVWIACVGLLALVKLNRRSM